MYTDKALGMKLRQTRISKHISQEQLAELVSLKRTSITNIESGKQALSLRLFIAICEQLGILPGDFLTDFFVIKAHTLHKVTESDVKDPKARNTIDNFLNQTRSIRNES